MSNIILSICIPTYNRGKILYNIVNHILASPCDEFEIVVSDNASLDNTESLMRKIKDPRVKYFRRPKNYGSENNFIHCVRRATGKYVFFIADDDIVEIKEIPWLIDTIKKNTNITQILGTVGDKRPGSKSVYQTFGDNFYKAGHESLINLSFKKTYLAGSIFKREAIDMIQARKYIGCEYIHMVFGIQAMKAGDSLCTSRIVASVPENPAPPEKNFLILKQYCANKMYYHPLSRLSQAEDRINIIKELFCNYPIVQKFLLKHSIAFLANYFSMVLVYYPREFIKIAHVFLTNKTLIFSFTFYKNFVYYSLRHFIRRIKSIKNEKLRMNIT